MSMSRRELSACCTCRLFAAGWISTVFPYTFSRAVAKLLFLNVMLHSSVFFFSIFDCFISTQSVVVLVQCPLYDRLHE